jgi:hypothetical protein
VNLLVFALIVLVIMLGLMLCFILLIFPSVINMVIAYFNILSLSYFQFVVFFIESLVRFVQISSLFSLTSFVCVSIALFLCM